MSFHIVARCTLALVAFLSFGNAIAGQQTYVNDRFGTSIAYPDDVFTKRMLPPENGDGQSWQAPDGATLLAFGRYNVSNETPKSIVAAAKKDSSRKVTYSKSGKDWAVLSGIETGSIFYERYLFGKDDVIHTVVIGYPPELAKKYDALVGPIAKSLSGP